jgi:hypothetical protein
LDRFVVAERAPKSIAPPTKSGSLAKLDFIPEKILYAEGSGAAKR